MASTAQHRHTATPSPPGLPSHATRHNHPSAVGPTATNDLPAAEASSLDPLETSDRAREARSDVSLGFDRTHVDATLARAYRDAHLAWRHSCWAARRERTLRVLIDAAVPAARLDRFTSCGSSAWILESVTRPGEFRLAVNRCRDRWCVPCQTDRRRTVCQNLARELRGRRLRLLTLTLRSTDAPLPDQLARLYRSFRLLRHTADFRRCVSGGLYFLELTLNTETRLWHPHLHILLEGSYLPQPLVKAHWLRITGDSSIVDIRAVRSSDQAASYVAKYAAKSVDARVVNDPPRFLECVRTLTGKRTFNTFGCWTDLRLSRSIADDDVWTPLAPLAHMIERARQGDPHARAILVRLRSPASPGPREPLQANPWDTS
jgi:hypothetical protein